MAQWVGHKSVLISHPYPTSREDHAFNRESFNPLRPNGVHIRSFMPYMLNQGHWKGAKALENKVWPGSKISKKPSRWNSFIPPNTEESFVSHRNCKLQGSLTLKFWATPPCPNTHTPLPHFDPHYEIVALNKDILFKVENDLGNM